MKAIPTWKVGIVLLCVLGMFSTACGPTPPSSINPSVCTPKSPTSNIYRIATPFATVPQNDKNQSLDTLTKLVKNWSSSYDIVMEQNQVIRITVIFISPEIIQRIIYNQFLYYPTGNLQETITNGMNSIAKRDEFIVLVIITAFDNNITPIGKDIATLDIPVKEITLTNTADKVIHPNHDDHVLDEIIHIRNNEFKAGFLGYPIAVGDETHCTEIMDPKWTTSVTIKMPSYNINGTNITNPIIWDISYRSLIDLGSPPGVLNIDNLQSNNVTDFQPLIAPPPPDTNLSEVNSTYLNDYWHKMARFVWWQVVYKGQH